MWPPMHSRWARQAIDRWTTQLEQNEPSALKIPWFDYIECVLLYREAHQTITGVPAPDQQRLQNDEARGYAAAARRLRRVMPGP